MMRASNIVTVFFLCAFAQGVFLDAENQIRGRHLQGDDGIEDPLKDVVSGKPPGIDNKTIDAVESALTPKNEEAVIQIVETRLPSLKKLARGHNLGGVFYLLRKDFHDTKKKIRETIKQIEQGELEKCESLKELTYEFKFEMMRGADARRIVEEAGNRLPLFMQLFLNVDEIAIHLIMSLYEVKLKEDIKICNITAPQDPSDNTDVEQALLGIAQKSPQLRQQMSQGVKGGFDGEGSWVTLVEKIAFGLISGKKPKAASFIRYLGQMLGMIKSMIRYLGELGPKVIPLLTEAQKKYIRGKCYDLIDYIERLLEALKGLVPKLEISGKQDETIKRLLEKIEKDLEDLKATVKSLFPKAVDSKVAVRRAVK